METLFPQLLFLGPMFAPFVLRLGAAIAFALLAYHLYTHRAEVATEPFPLIGTPGTTIAWFSIGFTTLLALALALATGFYTQGAAILGCLAAIKAWVWTKRYPMIFPAGRTAYFLLALICLVLIATGPGAFAIDKPY